MKITEKIINIETGEETFTEREETASEKSVREKLEADAVKLQIELDARAEAKSALLDRLGITAEEAKLLLS